MNFFPQLAAADGISVLIVVALLLAQGFAWLVKQRKGGAAAEAEDAPPPAVKPAPAEEASFDMEVLLRRLISGEAPPPRQPPPLPGRALREVPPELWVDEEPAEPPPLRQPEPVVVRASVSAIPSRPAIATHLDRGRVSPAGARLVAQLRDPATARQAFLAAQVFGPPKGLEN